VCSANVGSEIRSVYESVCPYLHKCKNSCVVQCMRVDHSTCVKKLPTVFLQSRRTVVRTTHGYCRHGEFLTSYPCSSRGHISDDTMRVVHKGTPTICNNKLFENIPRLETCYPIWINISEIRYLENLIPHWPPC
jgi:hypothetical protein